MRGAHDFSIDVVQVARECRWCIWYIWQNRLRVNVLSVRIQQLLVQPNTVLHVETASGTWRRYEVTAWVISTAQLAWIVCQCQGKNIILWLTIEIWAIVLDWDWHRDVGGLCPTIMICSCRYRNWGMNKISWQKIWGCQVYCQCLLKSCDVRTRRCKWFRHDRLLDAIITASFSIYRQVLGNMTHVVSLLIKSSNLAP